MKPDPKYVPRELPSTEGNKVVWTGQTDNPNAAVIGGEKQEDPKRKEK